jgi:hypothetical protein
MIYRPDNIFKLNQVINSQHVRIDIKNNYTKLNISLHSTRTYNEVYTNILTLFVKYLGMVEIALEKNNPVTDMTGRKRPV